MEIEEVQARTEEERAELLPWHTPGIQQLTVNLDTDRRLSESDTPGFG